MVEKPEALMRPLRTCQVCRGLGNPIVRYWLGVSDLNKSSLTKLLIHTPKLNFWSPWPKKFRKKKRISRIFDILCGAISSIIPSLQLKYQFALENQGKNVFKWSNFKWKKIQRFLQSEGVDFQLFAKKKLLKFNLFTKTILWKVFDAFFSEFS